MAEGLPYDPTHPDNHYPKYRHHSTEESVRIENPDEERELTPAREGWFDLKRDAMEKKSAPKRGADSESKPSGKMPPLGGDPS